MLADWRVLFASVACISVLFGFFFVDFVGISRCWVYLVVSLWIRVGLCVLGVVWGLCGCCLGGLCGVLF